MHQFDLSVVQDSQVRPRLAGQKLYMSIKTPQVAQMYLHLVNVIALIAVFIFTMPGHGFLRVFQIEILKTGSTWSNSIVEIPQGHATPFVTLAVLFCWFFLLGCWMKAHPKPILQVCAVIAPMVIGRLLDDYVINRTVPWNIGSNGTYWMAGSCLVLTASLALGDYRRREGASQLSNDEDKK